MMSIDTLIANRECIPKAIRQAGYPSLATQTENDLAELCRMQAEELAKYQQQRDKLRRACEEALSLCNQCVGRSIISSRVVAVLTEALGEEADA